MNWKEFLKPTIPKILIFLFITLFSLYDYLTSVSGCVSTLPISDVSISIILHPFNALNVVSYITSAKEFYCYSAIQPKNLDLVVLDLVWYYILISVISFMIIRVYNKVKRK